MNRRNDEADALIPETFMDRTPEGDGKFEDVEYSQELADDADREAWARAEAADRRAEDRS